MVLCKTAVSPVHQQWIYWSFVHILWMMFCGKYQWLFAKLQYLQCISNGDTGVLYTYYEWCFVVNINGFLQDCSISSALAMEILKFCTHYEWCFVVNINGFLQNCSIFSALAIEILEFCTKPLTFSYFSVFHLLDISHELFGFDCISLTWDLVWIVCNLWVFQM